MSDAPHDDHPAGEHQPDLETIETTAPPTSLDEAATLVTLSPDQLDRLPFGVVRLDRRGTVVAYNRYESERTGRSAAEVVGHSFFGEVAPCATVQDFAGRFQNGVRAGSLFTTFPYRFDFRMAPREVEVTLAHPAGSEAVWLLIRDLPDATA